MESLLQDLVPVLRPELSLTGRERMDGRRRQVETLCGKCGEAFWKDASLLKRRLGVGCMCQRNRKYGDLSPEVVTTLGQRYDAMLQRCAEGRSQSRNYGDRGIKLKFTSRQHFIRWATETYPRDTYEGVDFDRIDNDGHYEPGNLALTSRRGNLINKRNNIHVSYMGQQVAQDHVWHLLKTDHPSMPFSHGWTVKLLRRGLTPQQIIQRAHSGKGRPRTTSSTPDPAIVSLYRGG